jgi:hypothetical protein
VSAAQLQAVLMKRFNEPPEERHYAAYSTALVAIADAPKRRECRRIGRGAARRDDISPVVQ